MMVLFWITLLVTLIGSNAEGEFSVLHTPESLTFVRTGETWESHLKEIFSAALGLSVEYYAEWKGMYIMDPFATPEAVVEVHVDGVPSLSQHVSAQNREQTSELKTKVFPLIVDENEPHTFKGLQSRIKQHFPGGRNKIVNVKLYSDKRHLVIRRAFGTSNVTANKPHPPLKLTHLNRAVEEDIQFLKELETLQTVIGKVRSGAIIPDNLIDFYHLRFRTLHLLSDFYGPISIQTKEAKHLLGNALQELNKAFVKAYDGSVLVTVVTTDVAHTRRSARSVTNPPGQSKKWPYQWREPPLDWKKIPLKPKKKAGRRQDENENTDEKQSDAGNENNQNDINEGKPAENEAPKENEPIKDVGEIDEAKPQADTGTDSKTIAGDEKSQINSKIRINEDDDDDDVYKYQKPEDSYAMFNIFLWFGVSIGFSLLAIIYACMDMDPGRDTIIYRLTSMRTKKEM